MLIVFVLKDNSVFSFTFEITRLACLCFSLDFSTNIFKCMVKYYSVL